MPPRTDREAFEVHLDATDLGPAGRIDADLLQLFRRAAFNVLVANRDDHLRNHGFVREPTGWRLSPAYDMNPDPGKPEHALALDERSAAPDLGALIATADLYRLDEARARQVIDEVREAAGRWRAEARRAGLPSGEIARMAGAFAA